MIRVAKDGNIQRIQEAIDLAAATGEKEIRIEPGVYRERVVVYVPGLKLMGKDAGQTVLTWSGCAKDPGADGRERGTFLSFSFLIAAPDITIENLTIRNDAGDGSVVGQAVAVYAAGDRAVFRNCVLEGHQDTLFLGPLMPKVERDVPYGCQAPSVASVGDCPPTRERIYLEACRIRGDVDFIFGPYRAWFERCVLEMNERGGWYTAANTPESQPYGFVFSNCRLTGTCPDGAGFLGRPWRAFARTVFLDCEMDSAVSPQGFSDWDAGKLVTERYAEFGTTGVRADLSRRHPGEKILTAEEAGQYSREAVLAGWDPRERE